jgi:hypothetical protein
MARGCLLPGRGSRAACLSLYRVDHDLRHQGHTFKPPDPRMQGSSIATSSTCATATTALRPTGRSAPDDQTRKPRRPPCIRGQARPQAISRDRPNNRAMAGTGSRRERRKPDPALTDGWQPQNGTDSAARAFRLYPRVCLARQRHPVRAGNSPSGMITQKITASIYHLFAKSCHGLAPARPSGCQGELPWTTFYPTS